VVLPLSFPVNTAICDTIPLVCVVIINEGFQHLVKAHRGFDYATMTTNHPLTFSYPELHLGGEVFLSSHWTCFIWHWQCV